MNLLGRINVCSGVLALSLSSVVLGEGMTSQDFFNQVSEVLKSPEGRSEMKRVIGQWTPQQKEQFSVGFSQQASAKWSPWLPMQIDKDNTWMSLRFSTNSVFLEVEVSDAITNDSEYFASNESRMKNHICTTPSNALLLMTGTKCKRTTTVKATII